MTFALIHADLLAHLRGNQWLVQNGYIPKAHAVLCDPPYGLEFMGKEWDKPKPSGLFAHSAIRTAVAVHDSGALSTTDAPMTLTWPVWTSNPG